MYNLLVLFGFLHIGNLCHPYQNINAVHTFILERLKNISILNDSTLSIGVRTIVTDSTAPSLCD